jgi:hypothetical protein
VFAALKSASNYETKTTLSAVLKSPRVSAVKIETAGRDCLVMYETILIS